MKNADRASKELIISTSHALRQNVPELKSVGVLDIQAFMRRELWTTAMCEEASEWALDDEESSVTSPEHVNVLVRALSGFNLPCYAKPENNEPERVNHPAHYGGKDNPYEVIKVLKAWLTSEEYRGFLKGNVIKYTARARKKGSESEDHRKAAWYANALAEAEKESIG
jgi:hypothetical protein